MKPALWPTLGLVRFFLALIVTGSHLWRDFPTSDLGQDLARFSGFAAVLGFLVVSGFSIAASYEKERNGFYRRRALRILPLYFLAIGISVLVSERFGAGTPYAMQSWSTVVQNLFFLQGFTVPAIKANAVGWSLSVEVLFYLLTPVLARLSQRSLITIAGASAILFMVDSRTDSPYYSVMEHGSAAAVLAWSWLAGFIAYRSKDHATAALVILSVVLGILNFTHKGLVIFWPVTIAVTALAIGTGAKLQAPRWLLKLMDLLGNASYPLYLFHLPFFLAIRGLGIQLAPSVVLAGIIFTSVLLDQLFDQPLKKLLKKGFNFAPVSSKESFLGAKRPEPLHALK